MLKKLSIYTLIVGSMLLSGSAIAKNAISFGIPSGHNADSRYYDHTYTFSYCRPSMANNCGNTLYALGQLYEDTSGTVFGNNHVTLDLDPYIHSIYVEVQVVNGNIGGLKGPEDGLSGSYISSKAYSVADSAAVNIVFDPLSSPNWIKTIT